jgi:predicted NBD/HSP70 family sugar kinase
MHSGDSSRRIGRRRQASAASVLRAVLDHGPQPRSSLAQLTGLSPASVTGHVGGLLSHGLLIALPERVAHTGMGRPYVPLDLNPSAGVVGGVHFAARFATVALLDLRGRVVAERRIPHNDATAEIVVSRSAHALATLLNEQPVSHRLLGVGIASGGWVDPVRGTIIEHDVLGWHNVPVATVFEHRLGVPVLVDSHARSLVRAEQLFGHPSSRDSVLSIFVGNVVDAAFAIGDLIHHGAQSRAGAIAHRPVAGSTAVCRCGRTGCFQATVSEQRLVDRAYDDGLIDEPSILKLIDVAVRGNAGARELFVERAELVGRELGPMIDMFGPALVLVLEPGFAYLPDCREALRRHIALSSFTVPDTAHTVVSSHVQETLLASAGGAVILDALYSDPLSMLTVSRAS